MINDILLSIIDRQEINNIELLETLKSHIDKKQFTKFFENLKFQDRSGKRIFMRNDFLVSTHANHDINNTFIIFNIYSEHSINDFISGMMYFYIFQEVPF